jgi:uncharacterized membrane protein YkoI
MRRLGLALLFLLAAAGPRPAAAACLTGPEARAALSRGEARPLAQVAAGAQAARGGRILRARLCRHAGRLVYRLTLMSSQGQVRSALADARSGQLLHE